MSSKSYEDPVFVIHRKPHCYKILFTVRVPSALGFEENTRLIYARSGMQAASYLVSSEPEFYRFVQIIDEGVAKSLIENAKETFVPLLRSRKCANYQTGS